MADFGRKLDEDVINATKRLLERPLIKYLNSVPGHDALNRRLAEANSPTPRQSSTKSGNGGSRDGDE